MSKGIVMDVSRVFHLQQSTWSNTSQSTNMSINGKKSFGSFRTIYESEILTLVFLLWFFVKFVSLYAIKTTMGKYIDYAETFRTDI